MNDDKQQEQNKGFSGGFLWFVIATILLVLLFQNLLETKIAKVAFSYQLEHLVNLQLIQPEDSRKTALNDNLVTFSGKFRERKTEEGKARFKYLELLSTNHELTTKKEELEQELEEGAGKISEAATLFLQLTGTPISKGGFTVVDDLSSATGKEHSVVINTVGSKQIENLSSLEKKIETAGESPEGAAQVGRSLEEVVRIFRSPALGIGDEATKQKLRNIEQAVGQLSPTATVGEKLAVYRQTLAELQGISEDLDKQVGHSRLTKLRSVRNYNDKLEKYEQVAAQLDDNKVQLEKARRAVGDVTWFFNNQELSTRSLEKQDSEKFDQWFTKAKQEWDSFSHNQGGIFKAPDQPLNTVLEKTFRSEEPAPNYLSYLFTALPILLIVFALYFLFSRQMKGIGSNAMNFGKSPAKMITKANNKITFKDVAGIDEAIEELQEIVEFLKSPQKFTALGGHIPKGVLCVGPPGTGKTLIAKAVAGEADRPFFSISGSDFVEMFVGVGASRIRDLFNKAKENAPCIIFMDEIDAVGRHRGAGIGGGHDEREQTLNQLLVEMDGFDTNEGVILMAATNRPDVLDKALLRPGRFDRRIIINLPDIKGRFDILKVHARKIKMDPSVDLMALARSTPGASGADLSNILNEAALLAARNGRTAVTQGEIMAGRDKVLYGKERRSLELDESEKRTTAYHESGHTIVSLMVEHADPIDKVTIIPRGMSLGATMFLPKKNRVSYWKTELKDKLAVLMGGRCAEEIFVGDVSSGAQQDFEQATAIARNMVSRWGMSEKLGTVAYDERGENESYMGMGGYQEKKYSDETAQAIDVEVRALLETAYEQAKSIILEKKEQAELMTQMLMEFETLDSKDVEEIVHNRWSSEEKKRRLKISEDLFKQEEQRFPSGDKEPGAETRPHTPTPPPLPPLPSSR